MKVNHVLMIKNVLLEFGMEWNVKVKQKVKILKLVLVNVKKEFLYRREIIKKNGVITIGNFVCKESIDDNVDCDLVHVSSHLSYDHAIFSSSHFDPVNNPCKLGSICNSGNMLKLV